MGERYPAVAISLVTDCRSTDSWMSKYSGEVTSPTPASTLHQPVNPVRFVTAASLFDGHDAAINIMRRLLQSQGVEVIHLGHNRSVDEVVSACVQEDVQGVAVSSYQGGHNEYFRYLVDQLRARGAGHVKVFGGCARRVGFFATQICAWL